MNVNYGGSSGIYTCALLSCRSFLSEFQYNSTIFSLECLNYDSLMSNFSF